MSFTIRERKHMEPQKNIKYLVVPDVHGRTFWKDALRDFSRGKFPNAKVIFLGDYIDPYTQVECITPKEAYTVFKNIMKWVKKHKEKVIMLLGNHDIHYIVPSDTVRLDFANFRTIQRYYKRYLDEYFNIAYEDVIGGKRFLFTHAGVVSGWLDHTYHFDSKPTAKFLNSCLHEPDKMYLLLQRSRQRGGYFNSGSPIWADLSEHIHDLHPPKNVFQVFGHSWCANEFRMDDQFIMLDCRKVFTIDDEGKIDQYKKQS